MQTFAMKPSKKTCAHVWNIGYYKYFDSCRRCLSIRTTKGDVVGNINAKKQSSNNYYKEGGIEVIDFIKAKLTTEQFKGFLLGTIIKYSGRANFKDSFACDIDKLTTYANYLAKEVMEDGKKK